jgi:aspartyl-tRNA(Asn)/glutamyl-tRNA(Gln) amidotransferase subunit B
MRSKEEARDYRYFPEPDLIPFVVEQDWINAIEKQLPELPDARKARLTGDFGLSDYDAAGVISSLSMANYFDEIMKHGKDAKAAANWLLGDISAWLNFNNLEMADFPVPPKNIADMIGLINNGTISSKLAKTVFEEMLNSGKPPKDIVKEKGLEQISDTSALTALTDKIIAQNPKSAEDYKAGKDKALGFLVGQIMKESKGKANPEIINQLLRDRLG